MIICICRNISDKVLKEKICNGCIDIESIQEETSACINCESCRDCIEKLLKESAKEDSK